MAINTKTTVIIAGAASATQATAVSNYNTAVATLYANAGSLIWNPATPGPVCIQAGCAMRQDAAVANGTYTWWGQFSYLSGS